MLFRSACLPRVQGAPQQTWWPREGLCKPRSCPSPPPLTSLPHLLPIATSLLKFGGSDTIPNRLNQIVHTTYNLKNFFIYLSNLTMPPSNPKCKGHSDTEQQSVTSMLMKKARLTHRVRSCTLTSASSGPSNAVHIDNDTSQLSSPFKAGELDSTDVAPSSVGENLCEDIEHSRSSDDGIPDDPDEDEDGRALRELP